MNFEKYTRILWLQGVISRFEYEDIMREINKQAQQAIDDSEKILENYHPKPTENQHE
jgi:hypothetical protein